MVESGSSSVRATDSPAALFVGAQSPPELDGWSVTRVEASRRLFSGRGPDPGSFDCVLLATRLGADDPVAVVDRLRATGVETPVVVLAADGDDGVVRDALAAGADDFVRAGSDDAALRLDVILDRSAGEPRPVAGDGDVVAPERSAHSADAFDDAGVGTFVLDDEFTVVWANEAVAKYFGLERADLLGRDKRALLAERIGPMVDSPEDFLERVASSYERNSRISSFRCHVDPDDGDPRWLRHWSEPLDRGAFAGGRIEHYVDVTAQRARQAELRRVESVVNTLQDAVWTLDADGRVTFVNEIIAERVGRPAADLVGLSQRELLSLAEAETVGDDDFLSLVDAIVDGEHESVRTELRLTVDGETVVRDVTAVPMTRGDRIVGVACVSRDVTERRRRKAELEASRERYQSLIDTAPDPIFVADAETGALVEANQAAVELRGEPRSAIVGRHQSELHPTDDRDRYRRLFEFHSRADVVALSEFEDEPIHTVTADGERVPVEISAEAVEVGDRTLVHGIFRDISERVRVEQILTSLNETVRELLQAKTDVAVAQYLVDVAIEVLGLPSVGVFFVDETDGVLSPKTWSTELTQRIERLAPIPPGDNLAWTAYVDAETRVRTAEMESVFDTTAFTEEIVVPIGDYGVFVAAATDEAGLDETIVELTEILAANAEVALDRVEHERHRRQHDRALERQNDRLERVEEANALTRRTFRSVETATDRRAIGRAISERLVEPDRYEYAVVAVEDPITDRLDPIAVAGDPQGYVESVSLDLDGRETAEPSVRSYESQEVVVVENTASDLQTDPWRKEALSRGVRSVMSVPLSYQGVVYGVVTIYSSVADAFAGRTQSILAEIGQTVGFAFGAADRRDALLSDRVVELEVAIEDSVCFLVRFARQTGTALSFERVVLDGDGAYLVFVRLDASSVDGLFEVAAESNVVEGAATVVTEHEDSRVVRLRVVDEFVASTLAAHGIRVVGIESDGERGRLRLEVPSNRGVHDALDVVTTHFPSASLVSKQRDQSPVRTVSLSGSFTDALTDRQFEAAKLAHDLGFFERPRRVNGADLADRMGISSSAFHKHLRAAERTLFELAFARPVGATREQ
jgi:PAS domain S-box-containing protein